MYTLVEYIYMCMCIYIYIYIYIYKGYLGYLKMYSTTQNSAIN